MCCLQLMQLQTTMHFAAHGLLLSPDVNHNGCREDGKVSFGYSTLRGKRANMEDFLQAKVIIRIAQISVLSTSKRWSCSLCSPLCCQ